MNPNFGVGKCDFIHTYGKYLQYYVKLKGRIKSITYTTCMLISVLFLEVIYEFLQNKYSMCYIHFLYTHMF